MTKFQFVFICKDSHLNMDFNLNYKEILVAEPAGMG